MGLLHKINRHLLGRIEKDMQKFEEQIECIKFAKRLRWVDYVEIPYDIRTRRHCFWLIPAVERGRHGPCPRSVEEIGYSDSGLSR